ncbi:MAG: hypothetical protein HY832_01020 [Candidatus Aenigmarchaeota archaeon]|nr:hypothetical protein [Candidatus Aenigmarchaeota archaeon]
MFNEEMKASIIFSVLGIIAGTVSFAANQTVIALVIAVVGALVARFVVETILKTKHDLKWYLGNGVVVYLFFWLITWTIFYNLVVI